VIKSVARNLWRDGEAPTATTWYEPLEEQRHVTAAVAFALDRPEVAGVCMASDVRLVPLFIEAERRRTDVTAEEIGRVLSGIDAYEPPFIRIEGRSLPDWLEPLVP
jgi:hypothetical protein